MRFICIHGHFYQPERENPFTGQVPLAIDAYPFHDWNARITSECYGPNAWSQIRDAQGRTTEIINNYEHISFNFGPTILSWLEAHAKEVYDAILGADNASRARFGGHGSALAQCYNHMIMPLANRRDKVTQVRWGIRDFQRRFGREPEGIWLPETAVDTETLEVLAENGIAFTILAPRQIAATRESVSSPWVENEHESVETRHPYLVRLSNGNSIAVFVYQGSLSRAIAFEQILSNGENFASRLLSGFVDSNSNGQLVHVATDGETYGHHHSFGDMALAYALRSIVRHSGVRLTNYGEFLRLHPATHEARILENTSWSCAHGVERWRSNCGCRMSPYAGWNQEWRAPLREALDWLRDELNPHFERVAGALLKDPWLARNDGYDVLAGTSRDEEARFFARHQAKRLTPSARAKVKALLRIQRHMMLMFSSCGWFFDDVSGLEAKMLLQHAGWVIAESQSTLKHDALRGFMERLRDAHSNDPVAGDGAEIFRSACPQLFR